ncbi:unnamed protein product, partial [Mesorhabditis belari]|uniref:TIL domain-containing protein n=1 Tax=Mesorhabditis belari TaxID=2138241 RepID=A0AAF3EQT6_9BILA
MKRIIVILLVFAFCFAQEQKKKCGRNEQWVGPCASRCEGTCEQPVPEVCTLECYQGCKCKPGFVRHNRKCINLKNCPKV